MSGPVVLLSGHFVPLFGPFLYVPLVLLYCPVEWICYVVLTYGPLALAMWSYYMVPMLYVVVVLCCVALRNASFTVCHMIVMIKKNNINM